MKPPSHGGTWVRGRSRPNKTAAGMTRTFDRHPGGHSDDANMLSVHGSCDVLNRILNFDFVRRFTTCPCCGQPTYTLSLSNRGRSRLRRLRRQREVIHVQG